MGGVPSSGDSSSSFFCDGTSQNPCAIEVTEPAIELGKKVPDTKNTAVIPINFAPATSGCPSPNLVTTDSEFGIERLLPAVDRIACSDAANPSPPIAFNTAKDGLSAVQALAAGGGVSVAFTDDPESPDQQAALTQGHDALIPVALSADVIGFKATVGGTPTYPQGALNLTPTEVAGLVTNFYSGWTSSDLVNCTPGTSWCVDTTACIPGTTSCSVLAQLNALATTAKSYLASAGVYSSFVRADPAGSTDQLTSWLCGVAQDPLQPITINGQQVTEPATPDTVLVNGLNQLLPAKSQLTSCPVTDTFPPLASTDQFIAEVTDPSQQLVKMVGQISPPGGTGNPAAGFAVMNWAEALYFGLDVANLQNPAGAFVAPTADSLDAALADAKQNPDGSYTASTTNTSDTAAYPMPSIIYAAVPTAAIPADQADQVKGLLNEILGVTGGGDAAQQSRGLGPLDVTAGADAGQLPPGFVPLTPTLLAQAQKDIANDINAEPAPPPPPPSTQPSASPGSTTPADQSSDDSSDAFSLGFDNGSFDQSNFNQGFNGLNNGFLSVPFQSGFSTTSPITGGGSNSSSRSHKSRNPFVALGPIPRSFLLEASSDRLLLPATLGLGLLALAWGLLLLSPRVRRGVLLATAYAGRQLHRLAPQDRPPGDPPR
jgi:PBP superfamily domain